MESDISGKLRLIYGSGPGDPLVRFTLPPAIRGASIGENASGLIHEIERCANENAGDLREMASREEATGRLKSYTGVIACSRRSDSLLSEIMMPRRLSARRRLRQRERPSALRPPCSGIRF